MLRVVCVKVGTLYSLRYVENLCSMVSRNLGGQNYKFYTITDNPGELGSGTEPIESLLGEYGWWAKLQAFDDGLFN
ncbi:MAG: hypothetical protein V3T30_01010, partial [Thermodesulfobacteriota bacterium]